MKSLLVAAMLSAGVAPGRHVETVAIPTRVLLRPEAGQLAVGFDPSTFSKVDVEVSDGRLLGTATTTRWRQGGAWVDAGQGLQSGPPTANDTSYYPGGGKQAGPGEVFEVEIHFQVFETDIPPQHHWLPRSERYRVVGEWTVKGALKAPPRLGGRGP
jgi:hypothetical protein